ncbi:hypothetical protein [Fibrella aquatica]|uniref:hypothetical protein n=1 Tax=Fibrella aquatica TaxID=3242487 RepID=UPI0035227619
MTSFPTPHMEAVDPTLQDVAQDALHWLHLDECSCELRQTVEEPRLDGISKRSHRTLGSIHYDEKAGQYTSFADLGGATPVPVRPRFELVMAQHDLITFLHQTVRL